MALFLVPATSSQASSTPCNRSGLLRCFLYWSFSLSGWSCCSEAYTVIFCISHHWPNWTRLHLDEIPRQFFNFFQFSPEGNILGHFPFFLLQRKRKVLRLIVHISKKKSLSMAMNHAVHSFALVWFTSTESILSKNHGALLPHPYWYSLSLGTVKSIFLVPHCTFVCVFACFCTAQLSIFNCGLPWFLE